MHERNQDPLSAAIHADDGIELSADIAPPLHLTSTFRAETAADFAEMATESRHDRYYTRYGNPTVSRAEAVIASLEGTEAAMLFATGMAAISTTALALLSAGDHVIAQRNHYMGTGKLVDEVLPRLGISSSIVDQTDTHAIVDAATDKTRLILLETPANPTLQLTDLEAVAAFAQERGITTLCDSTLASPINQRPSEHGIDLTMHAATKYLGGHHDLLAGIVCGSKAMIDSIWQTGIILGASSSPFDAWLLLRGMRTLGLRMRQHNDSALDVARFLSQHDRVTAVHYPGLTTHPQHALALKQMIGFGGLLSFSVVGGYEGAQHVMKRLRLVHQAVSLGGFESLAVHAAAMWEGTLGEAGAAAAGVQPDLIRLSVGLEATGDIIADLGQALQAD